MSVALPILPQRQPAAAPSRPTLSINTQQLRTFGKGSTSLRLDTLSAVSPTVRNTFSNAYEPHPSAARPSKLSLSIDPSVSNPQSSSTPTSAASTLSSALTSASSNESATISIPYKQPHNLNSILANSPARHLLPRKMTASRPLFPAEKKVSFRTPLEEEIKTTKYTMAHSDLESSFSSSSTVSLGSADSEPTSSATHHSIASSNTSDVTSSPSEQLAPAAFASLERSPRPRGPRTGEKRDSSESESDSDSAPETPVAGRRKRSRDWRWTLGPLPSDKSPSTSTSEQPSEDSN
ncbi:hypothetical protein EJ04DRAFT_539750 [Polyplosphaeria fusca]|uniref:Uncharacterized protein n=1 Tax=Polyplosphaeria fusca TaxID=682080 RepID=A0A9P4V5V5_9PLEO|nr:hypothetical protein EJ04DRAFT_539750 [Polyplosphaeria fusca]